MGSTLLVLRTLFENQIDSGDSDASSDPTLTQMNIYINNAIRRVVRREKPRELYSAAVALTDIVINRNTVALSSSIFVPDLVYFQNSSGTVIELEQMTLKQMIDLESANKFFDTANVGNPSFYDVRGTSLIFNKYFSRSATGAIKIYGIGFPTNLSADVDTIELPVDYDTLIAYEAAILFYQKDDDLENQQKFMQLAKLERNELKLSLNTDDSSIVQLDPRTFGGVSRGVRNPSVFFGS